MDDTEQVKQEITERGYKLGRSFEDDQIVYASFLYINA